MSVLAAAALARWYVYFVRPGLPSSREVVASRQVAAQADLTALHTQLQIYKQSNGFHPTTEQGLAALVVKPDSSPIPQHWIQHLSKLPRDPWRRDYVYRLAGSPESGRFDVYSHGADGVDSSDDFRVAP